MRDYTFDAGRAYPLCMAAGLRILIASPLGRVISAPLQNAFDDVTVCVATTDDELTSALQAQLACGLALVGDDVLVMRREGPSKSAVMVKEALVQGDGAATVAFTQAHLRRHAQGVVAQHQAGLAGVDQRGIVIVAVNLFDHLADTFIQYGG